MRKGIGIDLGGTNLRVCVPGNGTVISEPSLAALDRASGLVMKFGKAAQDHLSEGARDVVMTRPFKGGVITNCEIAQKVFGWCRKRCVSLTEGDHRALLSIPCALSDVEQSAMIEVAVQAGLAEPYLVYAPLAAIYGCGLTASDSVLCVNIGSSKTDIIAIDGGKCLYHDSCDAAGDMFDDAIVTYVKEKFNLRLGLRTAETVKKRIGTLWNSADHRALEVGGVDNYGNRQTVSVRSDEMFTILEEPTAILIEAVCRAISAIPLESVKAVFDAGILLTGGSARLDGIDKMISGVTGVRCRRVEEPESAVIRGMEKLLANSPPHIRAGCINFSELLFR